MRILLLGATGFVGKHLLEFLSSQTGLSITATINNTEPKVRYPNVQYVKKGLASLDYTFLKEGDYDYIFHMARIPGKGFGDIGRWYAGQIGYIANRNLLRAIQKLEKKPKLIYMSGTLMYGNNKGIDIGEQTQLNPVGFARYYHRAEQPVLKAVQKATHDIIMLRAPWIIGNGSWFRQLYLNNIKTSDELPVYGNPERHMSLISVEDCAQMALHYAQNAHFPGVYNIYTFRKVAYHDFINMIRESIPGNVTIREYNEASIKNKMGKTVANSICSDIVLKTEYNYLLNSYKIVYPDLQAYIQLIIK